ncbi:MotA/TolQ/ExbB proton channel family protein [Methanobrevibacter olleyae]|uniref:Biopolymer transport protein ExbB/TolQ n=1 Tax=Methanobrevibacter olleyae TaxID=294671 RepID=A0A126R265_METOL|nr:MotA/TolQ/ExbB proton channel family protein [Methanobrevibacter olleyae]AMK16371.1 MotA/TolQ/ExbB proton channel family protein [Methanobrevibacter olleyae]SFL68189.1 Biopolymer transport protein ExbB/TolQ [Methanobrevibacter olleyae]
MINVGDALIFADGAVYQGSNNGLFAFFSNTNGTGLAILDSSLTAITQALQIPVIILLIAFLIFAVYTLAKLLSQYLSRKKVPVNLIKEMIYGIYDADSADDIRTIVNNADIQKSQKKILVELAESEHLGKKSRETLARRLIDNEEDKIAQYLNKTDIVTRIGPTLGLMGTLIPMGPGLAALGTGDVATLASAITIAFNTTVIGIGSGAIGYFASKIRRRWFGEYLANLDALMDAILDNINKRDERIK